MSRSRGMAGGAVARRSVIRERIIPLAWLLAAMLIFGAAAGLSAPRADAAPSDGCERIDWGLHILTPQKRTICDGPRRADGSWERWRQLWTPAHYVPRRMSCSGYGYITCTEYGGYHVADQVWEEMTYVVFDHNVLDGEPGWLPPGTAVLR